MQTQKQKGNGEGEGMKVLSDEFRDLIESLWKMEQTSNKVLKGIQKVLDQSYTRVKNVRLPASLMDENDRIRKHLKYFEKENEKLAEKISINAASLVIMFHENSKLKEEKMNHLVEIRTLQNLVQEWKMNYEKKEKECQEAMCEKTSLAKSLETLCSKHTRKEEQMKRLNEQLKQLEDTFDAIKSQSQLYVKNNENFVKEKNTLIEDNVALKKKISDLQRLMTEKSYSLKKEQEMRSFDDKIESIVYEMEALKKDLDVAKKEINEKNEEVLKLNKMLLDYESKVEQGTVTTPSQVAICEDTLSSSLQPSLVTIFNQINDEGGDVDDVITKIMVLKNEIKLSEDRSRHNNPNNINKNEVAKPQFISQSSLLQNQLANIQTDLTEQKRRVQELETCLQEKETEYKYELHTMNERLEASEKNNHHYKNYISLLRSSIQSDMYSTQ